MKSNIEKVYSKLPKTELAKVELASIAELNKFVSSLKTALKQLESNRSKLSSNLKDIEKVENDLKKNYNTALKNKNATDTATKNAEKLADQIAKQAKELGINPRSIDNVDVLISLIEQIEGTQETIDSFINMSKKYI
jgi:chromosome segregation ATPase